MGSGCLAAVCAGNRVAGDRPFHSSIEIEECQPLRLQGNFQSDPPGKILQTVWMGIAMALWTESGTYRADDRKLSDWPIVAMDAALPLSHHWVAARGF